MEENEQSGESTTFLNKLETMRIANINMLGNVNIIFVRNKFELPLNYIKFNLNMLIVFGTKLNSIFLTNQFTQERYWTPTRFN